jgi:septal ring factor EnvC (AmiA/AmiB activator)
VQNERDTLKTELSATQIKLAEMERTRRENDEIMRGLIEMEEKLKSVEQMKRSYETRISALKKRLAEANKMLTVQAKNRSVNYFDVIEMSEENPKEDTLATNSKTDAHTAQPHTPSLFDLAEEKPSASNWLQPLPDD